jgi:hypothetical protein
MRLRRHRCIELSIVVAALFLVGAPPAWALGTGEESGGVPTPGETATEPPGGTTEPAPASPGSTGWTPVGDGTGASSDGASSIQRGSSLGSGGGSEQTRSTGGGSEPVRSSGEEPSYAGSADDYESESSTPSTFEQADDTAHAQSTPGAVAPSPAIDKAVDVALGAATPVVRPKPHQGGNVSPAAPVPAAPSSDSRDPASSGSNALLLLAAIVLGLSLVYAGWRLGSHLWDRRAQRRHLEVRWSREADWEAFRRRIELTQAPGASNLSGEQLQPTEVGSDLRH